MREIFNFIFKNQPPDGWDPYEPRISPEYFGLPSMSDIELVFASLFMDYLRELPDEFSEDTPGFGEFEMTVLGGCNSPIELFGGDFEISEKILNSCISENFKKYPQTEVLASWIMSFWNNGYNILEDLFHWVQCTEVFFTRQDVTDAISTIEITEKFRNKGLLKEWQHLLSMKLPTKEEITRSYIESVIEENLGSYDADDEYQYQEMIKNICFILQFPDSIKIHSTQPIIRTPLQILQDIKSRSEIAKILDRFFAENYGKEYHLSSQALKFYIKMEFSDIEFIYTYDSPDSKVGYILHYYPFHSESRLHDVYIDLHNKENDFWGNYSLNRFYEIEDLWKLDFDAIWQRLKGYTKKIADEGFRSFFSLRSHNEAYFLSESVCIEILCFWLYNYPEMAEEYLEISRELFPEKNEEYHVEDLLSFLVFRIEEENESTYRYFESDKQEVHYFFIKITEILSILSKVYPSAKLFKPDFRWYVLENTEILNIVKNLPGWNELAEYVFQKITEWDAFDHFDKDFLDEIENSINKKKK